MTTKSRIKQGALQDEDIARYIRQALKLDSDVPDERITVQVHNGLATLEGNVSATLQKEAAEADARKVRGVLDVTNLIDVQPAI